MTGDSGRRSLEKTPTWAISVVCLGLVLIVLAIKYIIRSIGKWLQKKNKRALLESLEKIKSELMLMGFISLLLTLGKGLISNICIRKSVADTWHPCSKHEEDSHESSGDENRRKLLGLPDSGNIFRRVLNGGSEENKCAAKGKVSFVSTEGIHQLHIFIFVLACFHVIYCVITMALARLKRRKWKQWEKESKTLEYQIAHDPDRFRFARETTFGRRHLMFWTNNSILIWTVCFFRQFIRPVPRVDYLTLRHGFIMAHLTPTSTTHFNFQKYIKRSMEEDFKVVVGISPPIWFLAVLFLLFHSNGWYSYVWLPYIPLMIVLLVGTKLQVIITKMGLRIEERGEIVKGSPVVELGDELFWFNRPRLILHLISFILFQNAFQAAFFVWTWVEFGLKSCFHEHMGDVIIEITTGVVVQILCSYVTLPLYALVTQMGSTMKPTVFNERIATAIKRWHHKAKKNIKRRKLEMTSKTPISTVPTTPSHHASPLHLRHHHREFMDHGEFMDDSLQTSPTSSVDDHQWAINDHSHSSGDQGLSSHHQTFDNFNEHDESGSVSVVGPEGGWKFSAEDVGIDIVHKEFSFAREDNNV